MTFLFFFVFILFIDDDSGEKSINVLLGGDESELIFIDHAFADMTVRALICLIYSLKYQ